MTDVWVVFVESGSFSEYDHQKDAIAVAVSLEAATAFVERTKGPIRYWFKDSDGSWSGYPGTGLDYVIEPFSLVEEP